MANIKANKNSDLSHLSRNPRWPELDSVIFLETVDSTNLEVKRRRNEFQNSNVLIVSDEQTQGQGQSGRTWESAAGKGLWMSLHLGKRETLSHDPQLLSIYTGIVVQKIISPLLNSRVLLKWPNDILIGPKKCGGILTELQWQGEQVASAIIGVGINLDHRLIDFPESLREQATSLLLEGVKALSRSDLIDSFIDTFFNGYQSIDNGAEIAMAWNSRAYMIGDRVQWKRSGEVIEGIFSGINPRGDAVIQINGDTRTFQTGEIRLLSTS